MLWNIRKESLSVFLFLNFMQAAGHNIAHTISNFLLEVLRVGNANSNKMYGSSSKWEFFINQKTQKSHAFLE